MGEIFTEELINATFMFCYRRLNNASDAEDLAQDIMCEALRGLRKSDKAVENFHAWYWALARNRFNLFLRMKRYNAVSLDEFIGDTECSIASDSAIDDFINGEADAEEKSRLNLALSRLSALHREVIIAFYLRGESVACIAKRLDIPVGTVKRRLFDAKNNTKKGLQEMNNTGRAAFAPARLDLVGGYNMPDYWDKVSDIMAKQIFVACRGKALTVREIADEIGVAPVYFEDRLKYLLDKKFLKETSNGRYITDFVILPAQASADYNYEHSRIFANIGAEVTEAIKSVEDKIRAIGFYGSEFDFSYLLWILYVHACSALSKDMLGIYRGKWAGKVPDGNGKDYRINGTVTMPDEQIVYRELKEASWSNLHKHFKTSDYSRICHANLFQAQPFGERDFIITDENADMVMKLYDNPGYPLTRNQEEQAAALVRLGYLRRDGSSLRLTMPVMTWEQQQEIIEILAAPLHPLAIKYVEAVSELSDRMLLPLIREDLLEEYVNRIMMLNFWPLGYVLYYGMNDGGTLAIPQDYAASAAGIELLYRK